MLDLEFSLWASPLRGGFDKLKAFLPAMPNAANLAHALQKLHKFGCIDAAYQKLTPQGQDLALLPLAGSVAMARAFYAALKQYSCGEPFMVLLSVLSCMNTSQLTPAIPAAYRDTKDGDFMSWINVMGALLTSIKYAPSVTSGQLTAACTKLGFDKIAHVLIRAYTQYMNMRQQLAKIPAFASCLPVMRSGNNPSPISWESIARSLLVGYSDHVFASCMELQGKQGRFVHWADGEEDTMLSCVIDSNSTLNAGRKSTPPPLVIARDLFRASSMRGRSVIAFVGRLDAAWVGDHISRTIAATSNELACLSSLQSHVNGLGSGAVHLSISSGSVSKSSGITLSGPAGAVFLADCAVRKFLVLPRAGAAASSSTKHEIPLTLSAIAGNNSQTKQQLKMKEEDLMRYANVFNPMVWRWASTHQVTLTVDTKKQVVRLSGGREHVYVSVAKEIEKFLGWFRMCFVLRSPTSGLSGVLSPSFLSKPGRTDILKRVARITDPNRMSSDLKASLHTRIGRMEAVAWTLICTFECKLEGGFVRDWIVAARQNTPMQASSIGNPWVHFDLIDGVQIPRLHEDFLPQDLDCHLPYHRMFDVDLLLDKLHYLGIHATAVKDGWRYCLLCDEGTLTGPFTCDLIEPHVVLTQDHIDFDVNNLGVSKGGVAQIDMRVDITAPPCSITLESTIKNIETKQFHVLRAIDPRLQQRIDKMVKRGWSPPKLDRVWAPSPPQCASLTQIGQSDPKWAKYQAVIAPIGQLVHVETFHHATQTQLYEAVKKVISMETAVNEREDLYHGTSHEGAEGIEMTGYDNRHYSVGLFGSETQQSI